MKTLLRRAPLGMLLAFATITLIGAPAHATEHATTAVVATGVAVAFTLDPALVIQLVVSTVLPLLVGLVTKVTTHAGIKAVLLAAFALATSLLTELGEAFARGDTYDAGRGLLLALPTFLIAVGLHYGLWKPVGAATAAQRTFTTGKTLRRDLRMD